VAIAQMSLQATDDFKRWLMGGIKMDKCEISHCRDEMALIYLGHDVCEKHWQQHCAGKINLKQKFGIEVEA